MNVIKATQFTVGNMVEEIRALVTGYKAENDYAKADPGVCLQLCFRATQMPDGCLFLLVDKDNRLRGYLIGTYTMSPFNLRRMAVQVGMFIKKGFGGHAQKLYNAFEAWAVENMCEQVHLHVSVPFDEERWDKVMGRRGYTPVERVYAKEV